jgi:hypothetical protein
MELGGITNSTSTRGVITKNGMRFMHNYQAPGTHGFNTFIGLEAGNFTMSGQPGTWEASFNTTVGYGSLFSLTTGYQNSAFGSWSLYSNTTGSWNSAFGYQSLYSNTTGIVNSAFGYQSLLSNTTGSVNSAFGERSLFFNTTGNQNSAFGSLVLYSNTTGIVNSAFGERSLFFNTTGNQNSAFGSWALYNNSTGSNNTAIGDYAGFGASEVNFNQCTFVGANSYPTDSRSNVTMLGYGITNEQVTGDNQVCLGNTAVTQIRAQVTSITSYSDARYKVNVKDNVPGLDFILKLKPVTFNVRPTELHKIWGTPDSLVEQIDHSEAEQETRIGFIAQEVEKAAKECGFDFPGIDIPRNEKEAYTMRYVDFIMPMVKAIQELKEKSDAKDVEIANLKHEKDTEIAKLKDENNEIKSQLNEILQVVNELKKKQDDVKNVKLGGK